MPRLRLGTRASDLALWQASYVAGRLHELVPDLTLDVVRLTTSGDELPDAPLERMEGTGFFTSTIERALLANEIDLAVHSCKDLPTAETAGLQVRAIPERGPVADVLCARDSLTLEALPPRAVIGTSSPRRSAQLRALRPDLRFESLRGNVPTRLRRLERRELDAVILARAGLERLGLTGHITEEFPPERVLPAPAQGALAVQIRADDAATGAAVAVLEHPPTRLAVTAERGLLHALRGGCSVPVGAHARAEGSVVVLEAGVFDPEGGPGFRANGHGPDPVAVGRAVAGHLLALGAGGILERLERAPRLRAWEAP